MENDEKGITMAIAALFRAFGMLANASLPAGSSVDLLVTNASAIKHAKDFVIACKAAGIYPETEPQQPGPQNRK